jgi:hypothetical protein
MLGRVAQHAQDSIDYLTQALACYFRQLCALVLGSLFGSVGTPSSFIRRDNATRSIITPGRTPLRPLDMQSIIPTTAGTPPAPSARVWLYARRLAIGRIASQHVGALSEREPRAAGWMQ